MSLESCGYFYDGKDWVWKWQSRVLIFQGAKEFVVPTRQKGKFYTLPQSPQQVCFQGLVVQFNKSLLEYKERFSVVLMRWNVYPLKN